MPFKTLNNHLFHYETSGIGSPILFIHGLGSSTLDWEKQIPFFEKNYKTIAIDLRGHGQTKGSKGSYSVNLFAEDVSKLLENENEKVHIIGISMGGMTAFQLALDYPNLVKSMVIINSFVELDISDPKVKKEIRLRKIVPRILGMRLMGKVIGKKLFPAENQKHLRKIVTSRWAKNNTKDYLKSINSLAGWSVKDRVNQIQCPVLVIGAENDFSTVKEKEDYTKLMQNGEFVMIPDSGHAVVIERPEEVNKTIQSFLKAITV